LLKSETGSYLVSTTTISQPVTCTTSESPSDISRLGSTKTKSHPNLDGTAFNPKPIELKFRLIKNPKGFEIMGKEGKDSNPIPPRNAGKAAAEMGRAEAAVGDAMRERFEVGA